MKKKVIKIIIVLLLIPIVANVLSVVRLYFGSSRVTKAYFTPYYYAKIEPSSNDIIEFKSYMISKGWRFIEQDGGLFKFGKDNKEFEIINTQIKTIFIDKKAKEK